MTFKSSFKFHFCIAGKDNDYQRKMLLTLKLFNVPYQNVTLRTILQRALTFKV